MIACPDSDQIPQRREMTLSAISGCEQSIADSGQPNDPVDLWVHGLKCFAPEGAMAVGILFI
jgi:hypothetical protein